MKKIWIIAINVIIMTAMLVFVLLYSRYENKTTRQNQIEHFENTTIALERVTENYLEGEQRICDVWARYINSKEMTIDEAISFIRVSHVLENASAHIVFKDTRKGLSTRSKIGKTDSYEVSYEKIDFLMDVSWIHDIGQSINISREYTNSISGEQSIAFCNMIKLKDGSDLKDAILLRVLPSSELIAKWVFPQEEFEDTEFAIIDSNGNYIIKGYSFKNSNFFEFYLSYNSLDGTKSQEFFDNIKSQTDSFTMKNSKKEKCILAHTPFGPTNGWTLLSLMPIEYLNVNTQNWLLIGFVSIGLLLLFIFDFVFMMYFNKKLKSMAKDADFANKAKTDFLSAMSHDIRTPMNAIVGFTTIANKNLDDKKIVEDSLYKITLASNHLLTLINDILDISKVESGKLVLTPQSFSLVETVKNLINISSLMIKEKNIDFKFYINNIFKENLYADLLRLNQIFINILSNAIKYTEKNGKIIVSMKEEQSLKEGYVKLTYIVSDTGIGMTPEFMKTMYQQFSRQVDSRVNSIQGTGLGLAITKQMVDLMEGSIDCESEVGVGTKFTVTIDLPVSNTTSEDYKLSEIDALIIDNDVLALESQYDILKSLGINVTKSEDGIKSLELIKERHDNNNDFDIIICDLSNNNINVMDFSNKIRKELKINIPIIITSNTEIDDLEKVLKEYSINAFLQKPLFKSILYKNINELLGNDNKIVNNNDYKDLSGINILVAEDYDINYEIISSLLEMYGINTERAENGKVCVDKIINEPSDKYALIFMDIQMPVMNGLDATKMIRNLDDPSKSSIPIIAMTSDAFSENVKECLDVGMNGHIAKPIDINLVIKEIKKVRRT